MAKNAVLRREKLLSASEGYLMLEMPQHALAALDAIEDPERAPFAINMQRGEILRHLEQHREALAAFEKAFEVEPDNVSLLLAMAWCYKRTAQLPRAIESMEKAYRAAPKQPIVLYNLACYWTLAGNKTQALSWLGRALRLDKTLRDLIPHESDFDPLRDDPDFQLITGAPDEMSSST